MTLPLFSTTEDPGPDFAGLIRRLRVPMPPAMTGGGGPAGMAGAVGTQEFRHGTTVVALRYADGIVMAGDRRATEGHVIAHRAMEKVFPADRYSAVAIAGAAGPAVEMVRLFQTQLEHYEKVEGVGPQPRGQGQPAGPDGARAPAHGHAGPGRRAPLRRLRPGPGDRAASSPTT